MKKLYLLIALITIAGCKKIYDPDIDSNKESIVINGVITDNAKLSKVKITQAKTFRHNNREQFVSGAVVKVFDNDGVIYNLSETSLGVYRNPNLKAETGKTYFLEVISPEGDIYRSETQSLPAKVKVDSIFGEILDMNFTEAKLTGELFLKDKEVMQPYFNLTNSVPVIPTCRFYFKNTILALDTRIYVWKTFNPLPAISSYSKYQLNTNQIKKNPLSYVFTNVNEYVLPEPLICYFLFIEKYDLNESTFQYYKEMKLQSEYAGKIFDPIPTQIKGNITCMNNPEKMVLGLFEVSNGEQFIYKCAISGSKVITFTRKDSLINYTEDGKSDIFPEFAK